MGNDGKDFFSSLNREGRKSFLDVVRARRYHDYYD
jgi:hypothetical protein